MNDQERVDWVRMQADCLLHRLFENLYKIVEDDLEQANQCSPLANDREFILKPNPLNGHSHFAVERQPKPNAPPIIRAEQDNAWVKFTFKASHNTIEIRCFGDGSQPEKVLKVEAKWDHDSDTCGITINGEPNAKKEFYKPWQISREGLSPLIFP